VSLKEKMLIYSSSYDKRASGELIIHDK
jgi:hypothetical protein